MASANPTLQRTTTISPAEQGEIYYRNLARQIDAFTDEITFMGTTTNPLTTVPIREVDAAYLVRRALIAHLPAITINLTNMADAMIAATALVDSARIRASLDSINDAIDAVDLSRSDKTANKTTVRFALILSLAKLDSPAAHSGKARILEAWETQLRTLQGEVDDRQQQVERSERELQQRLRILLHFEQQNQAAEQLAVERELGLASWEIELMVDTLRLEEAQRQFEEGVMHDQAGMEALRPVAMGEAAGGSVAADTELPERVRPLEAVAEEIEDDDPHRSHGDLQVPTAARDQVGSID
jgi:hypothetical protein